MSENIGDVGNLRQQRRAQEFLHAVARIALAQSCDRRIHGDYERRETSAASPVERALGGFTTAEQVELIPDWSL